MIFNGKKTERFKPFEICHHWNWVKCSCFGVGVGLENVSKTLIRQISKPDVGFISWPVYSLSFQMSYIQ